MLLPGLATTHSYTWPGQGAYTRLVPINYLVGCPMTSVVAAPIESVPQSDSNKYTRIYQWPGIPTFDRECFMACYSLLLTTFMHGHSPKHEWHGANVATRHRIKNVWPLQTDGVTKYFHIHSPSPTRAEQVKNAREIYSSMAAVTGWM